jgi:tetratricopeptide (TPR) repeat protein
LRAEAYDDMGGEYLDLGQTDNALAAFGNAIAADPRRVHAYLSRALVAGNAGRLDDAYADQTKAIEIAPGNAGAYSDRSYVLLLQGKPEESLRDSDRAIELDPDNGIAYANRGAGYAALGKHDAARVAFLRATQLAPSMANAYRGLAQAYLALNQPDQALPYAEKLLTLRSGNAVDVDARAQIFERLGRTEDAIADYRAALALKPDLPSSRQGLERLLALPAGP